AESDGLRRSAAGGHDAGETRVPAVGRRDPHGKAADTFDADVRVHSGDGAGLLCGFLAPTSSAISETRTHADRHSAGGATASAVHLLALSGIAASGHCAATADGRVA